MKTQIFTIFCLFVFSLETSAGVFKINSDIEIVTTDSSSLTQNAAQEMKKYLEQILQKSIVVSSELNRSISSIILTHKKSNYAAKLSFFKELSSLKKDSFIIQNEDNDIIIAGSNHRALFYGVYHFLERYMGCKFLTIDFEIIPKKIPQELININDIQIPRFTYREFFSAESDNLEFSTKCRLNGRLGHRSAGNYQDENFPKGKIIYNQFVSSQLIGDAGYECNGQYDFSQNEVAELALDSVNKKLSELDMEKDDFILLEHEDRDSYCLNGLQDEEVPGNPFLKYSAYIAENLKEKFQDTHVLYQAYQWSRKPPKKIELLPKNMSIFFSPIEADFSKALSDKANQTILDDLKDWNRFGHDIFIWHYVTNFGGYFQPYPNIYALDSDIKLFDSLEHIQGVFLQSSYETFGSELADLRTWVFSKLLWNPNLDINLLIGEFCDAYYGGASREVQKYIRVLYKIHQKMDEKLLVKSTINSKYLQQEFLGYLENILDIGLKKVTDEPEQKAHFLKLYSGIDYVRVMRGDDINLQKSKKRFRQFLSTTKGIEYFAEGGEIDIVKKLLDINRKIPLPPQEAKGLKEGIDWFDFQEYTLKLCCADLIADMQSSDGVSAVMKGNLGDWGFQLDVLNFPKGKWDIYANVKVEFSKSPTLMDSGNIAFYFGVHPTFIEGAKLFGQCKDGIYQSVKIGTIDTTSTKAKTIWLSPPENSMVKAVYVDRLYIVREKIDK